MSRPVNRNASVASRDCGNRDTETQCGICFACTEQDRRNAWAAYSRAVADLADARAALNDARRQTLGLVSLGVIREPVWLKRHAKAVKAAKP